jgi:hypothetical protein
MDVTELSFVCIRHHGEDRRIPFFVYLELIRRDSLIEHRQEEGNDAKRMTIIVDCIEKFHSYNPFRMRLTSFIRVLRNFQALI